MKTTLNAVYFTEQTCNFISLVA